MEKIIEKFGVEIRSVDREKHTLDMIFSTADEDRHGDIVHQNWELENFKRNPVILNSHRYDDATEVVGRSENTRVEGGKLQGTIRFAVKENPKAKVIFDLYAEGFLSATSVGFMPKEFNDRGEILRSELLEVSAVSVPANAYALAKQKGIDVDLLNETTYEQKSEANGNETDTENKGGDGETQSECPNCKGVGGEDKENSGQVPKVDPATDSTDSKPEGEKPEDREDGKSIRHQAKTERRMSPEEQRKKALGMVMSIIKEVDRELLKVETRSKSVRAKRIRQINKVIRDLNKIKRHI